MQTRMQTRRDRLRAVQPLATANLFVLLAAAVLFVVIADLVADGEHLHVEEGIMEFLRQGEPPRPLGPAWLAKVARDVTSLGSMVVLTLLSAMVVGFLLLMRRFGAAIFLICAVGGGQSLNAALKLCFGRERPALEFRWTDVDSLSFPSGHASSATVVYLAMAVLLSRLANKTSHQVYIIGGALLLSFLVGLTRVYLRVHYPSDVIAGWALGIVWAQLCWFAARGIGRRRLSRRAG